MFSILKLLLLFLVYLLVHLVYSVWSVEEMSMKWMDRPSVTESERGGVYEIDRRKSAKNMEMPVIWIKCNNTF